MHTIRGIVAHYCSVFKDLIKMSSVQLQNCERLRHQTQIMQGLELGQDLKFRLDIQSKVQLLQLIKNLY